MKRRDYAEREERMQKALADYYSKKYNSISAAAAAYDIPNSTLIHRVRGRQDRHTAHQHSQTLSPAEEEDLCRYILGLCREGKAPRKDEIRDMAITIVQRRNEPFLIEPNNGDASNDTSGSTTGRAPVGQEWPEGFLNRHPEMKEERTKALMKTRHVSNRIESTAERYRRTIKRTIDNPTILPTVKEKLEEVTEQLVTQFGMLEKENAALREALTVRNERLDLEKSSLSADGTGPHRKKRRSNQVQNEQIQAEQ